LAADLKENKRATIVGGKSIGCMGATSVTNMADGSRLAVVTQEFVGAHTGTKYNNVGVQPDVQADDASAVDKAIEVLKQKI
jgi:carboxyl-terminal processing protease